MSFLANQIEAQRGTLVYWAPVMLAVGIGSYFGLLTEPTQAVVLGLCGAGVLCLLCAMWLGVSAIALPGLALMGFGLASIQTSVATAPVLTKPYFGTVEGRVIARDRSASNNTRLTLDQVQLRGIPKERTPKKVRVSLTGHMGAGVLRPGARVMMRARIGPPGAPVEPGGFDFRRHAWFEQIGAVGYTRDPVVLSDANPASDPHVHVFRLRMAVADWIRARMPVETGAFAAAIITGDRSEIAPDQVDALRASNLAHLLAISGLHMGLLTGFVFAVLRYGLALVPRLSLRIPVKKIAAFVALLVGAAYLVISGASVATQRAFIMAAVALVAVMLDRPVLTLRAVAIAASLVLIIRPVSLTGPGFQMSFAATTALVASFNGLRRFDWWHRFGHGRVRFFRPLFVVAFTSFVAGLATAPYSAFHFNGISQFGLIANVLAVPVMGLAVMPAAVVAIILAPAGLAQPALLVMSYGIAHILRVANWIAGLDSAVWRVPSGPDLTLALTTIGLLVLLLLRGPMRLIGVAPVALALHLWVSHERPLLLIAENGRTFGLQTQSGRVLSAKRGNSFAAKIWLENDGDAADMEAAFAREALIHAKDQVTGTIGADDKVVWSNAKEPLAGLCERKVTLIAPKWTQPPEGPCLFVGQNELRNGGAHAVYIDEINQTRLRTVRELSGDRPWTGTRFQN